jgi:hypothetical protein
VNTLAVRWFFDAIRGAGGEAEAEDHGDRATVLMNTALAQSLGLPDYCEFSLDGAGGPMPGITADLIDKCAAVFSEKGGAASGAISVEQSFSWPSEKKTEGFFKLARGKSTFRGAMVTEQSYLIGFGAYSAVSDEKRDGIVSAAVNGETGTIAPDFGPMLDSLLEENRIAPSTISLPPVAAPTLSTLYSVLRAETARHLEEFDTAIARRLERDCDRIYRYYKDLLAGAVRVGGKKKPTAKEQEERLDAIRKEHAKKTDDLRIKYLMKVEITPLALLTLRLPCLCARYTVQMGSASRELIVPWNPITAKPDVTLCTRCGGPAETVKLCREFHWLCRQCWQQCPECSKEYCPVCKPKGCRHG